MYAEAGLQYPFLQGFPPELAAAAAVAPAPYHHLHYSHLPALETSLINGGSQLGNMMPASIISEYDLGGEGDLFKAPEPIIEEPILPLDPTIAAMSIISGGDDVITETFKVADMESVQTDHLLNNVFYECKNELLEKSAIEESFSEVLDAKIPAVPTEEDSSVEKNRLVAEGLMQKSVSSGCLASMEWIHGSTIRPNFLDFQGLDFEAVFGMRRAYSEGDIQNLGNNNTNFGSTSAVHSSFEQLLTISDLKSEERRQKLSRYRKKKTERNFGRKIKLLKHLHIPLITTTSYSHVLSLLPPLPWDCQMAKSLQPPRWHLQVQPMLVCYSHM